jgi:outer membrane lipoprotein carrier protein
MSHVINLRYIILCFLLLAGFSSQTPAVVDSGSTQLKAFLDGLHTLQASFIQTVQQPDEDTRYTSNGIFYLKRPGRLRWEYDEPNPQVIVADGDRIWLHDIDLDQVSQRSQKAALEGTPAQLLSGTGPLEKSFKLQDEGEENGLSWVELRPREKDSQFVRLRLGLADNELRRMEMYDNFGQVTRFTFSDMKRNPTLSPKLFVFVPPPLIDLIGE